ncbi:MAG: sigma-70 family RNA polymerase sigma factor [Rhodothermales bacterium]|nr:sigma-70 family RNA polymerase sigma factor [Rhodothermales bacterium]
MSTDDARDQQLVRDTLAGERRAFGRLVNLYQKPVYNAALKIVRDTELAADITQTAFLKAFENLNTYNPKYRFFSWLYRIAINTALNEQQKRRSHESVDDIDIADDATPEDFAASHELEDRVGDALLELNPQDRALILLRHYQKFSYDELGFIFDVRSKTIKSRLFTARQRLKEIFEQRGIRIEA